MRTDLTWDHNPRIMLSWQRPRMRPANTPPDWVASAIWRGWEAPLGIIHGESHYGEALLALTGAPRPHGYLLAVPVSLIREPDNPMDGNAIRAEIAGAKVGYIARRIAVALAPLLDGCGCKELTVAGVIRGGYTERPNIGVHIWCGRRLSPGPVFSFPMWSGVLNWAPMEDEGSAMMA